MTFSIAGRSIGRGKAPYIIAELSAKGIDGLAKVYDPCTVGHLPEARSVLFEKARDDIDRDPVESREVDGYMVDSRPKSLPDSIEEFACAA